MQTHFNKISSVIWAAAISLGLTSCNTMKDTPPQEQAAVLTDLSESALEIVRSQLAIHKGQNSLKLGAVDPQNPSVVPVLPPLPSKHDTLNFGRPELFNIIVRDGQCFAKSQNDNALILLSGVSCKVSG